MKTPDKIFVNADPFGFLCAYDIENHPSCGEEYIRKDALLEWTKDKRKAINECTATDERKVAALSVIEALTTKLNSL